ncbi:condensin-2 complex subunit D3-like isoform X2 [Mizuhopecten yessoensis]|uniref:Condensin-2 complex subunit D3 n=1 Tax=Mizuhopecten yessoensis TaxID=6573 RepID=A0A210PG51_MIZYE|nr:condensin-2 complex subunit D3-like isoform X2 [Mizuhopecten yessoensis]OWF35473.1 Condensin-2 complex subunit D3 [Mizuhopecten yessoensis]
MADVIKTVEVLDKFELQRLQEDWVKSVWDSDFTEIDPIDIDLQNDFQENEYHCQSLRLLQESLVDWVTHKEGEQGEGFWTVLVENDIQHKHLIALFAYLIDIGQSKTADIVKKKSALLSCSGYLKLLTVPGSSAFHVFHPVLYEKTIDMLKQWTTIGSSKRKRSAATTGTQKGKKSRGSKQTVDPTVDINVDFSDDDDEDAEEMAPQEVTAIKKLLMELLRDLVFLLETTPMRQSEASLYHTVQILTELTRHETDTFNGNFNERCPSSRLPVAGLAYKGLGFLCLPLHNHIVSLFHAICKNLMPSLLMLIGDNKAVAATTIPKPVQVACEQATSFICHMMKQCGDRVHPSVRTLLQHMCTKVPDKTEYRSRVTQSVIKILKDLPNEAFGKMVEWFYRLSKHSKISSRAFTIEIASMLLVTPERDVDESSGEGLADYVKHRSIMGLLLARCSDSAPTVRARAITAFAQCFVSADNNIKGALREIVTPFPGPRPAHAPHLIPTPMMDNRVQQLTAEDSIQGAGGKTPDCTASNTQAILNPKTPFGGVMLTPFNPNLPDDDGVMSMLRRRSRDEKVNVRKSALLAVENIIRFEAPDYRRQNLELLVERCRDPALSARKQAMQSLTSLLLEMPTEKTLQQAWLEGVMPLTIDRESSLQDKCMETLEDILIHNIVPAPKSRSSAHTLAWDLLTIMEQSENVELRRYLQKACIQWNRQGKIKPNLITALETHIDSDNNQNAWMLLSEIAPAAPKLGHKFVLEYWQKQPAATQEADYITLQRVLTVMSCTAKTIPSDDRSTLIDDLKSRLLQFDSPTELIAITIKTLSKLCQAQAEATGDKAGREAWCTDLLSACDKYLSHVILEDHCGVEDEDLVVRHLFTLGEVVQICPARVSKRISLIVESFIAAPCISSMTTSSQNTNIHTGDLWQSKESENSGSSNPDSDGLLSTQLSQAPSSQQTNSQDFNTQAFTQGTQIFTQFRGSKMSNRIRAFAFITLGKLCLQNPNLAKKCVAALARELETSTDPAIRNNVVIIMCDLCVRYTTTADHYISNIASCLKDESPLVRKQTLTIITRLLQEDFMKWKGTLFFRFITTLLDECDKITDFAEFCLVHTLFQRYPSMFFHHFMECIFHFNAYQGHGAYNKFQQSERDRAKFSLSGKDNFRKRQKLYLFMLEHMTDPHRFQLTAKIVQEILGGVVDDIIPLNEDSACLLQDSLAILASKEIKLSSLKVRNSEDVVADEQEMAAVVMATAKKTLITQVLKKNVIENIVPVVVSLKHMLEQHRSPLQKDLLSYLMELMKDFKNEVKEILSADKQLASEIEFDLKKFEEQQEEQVRKRQNKNTAPSVQATPVAARPGSPSKGATPSRAAPGSTPVAPPEGTVSPHPQTPGVANPSTPRVGSPGPQTTSARMSPTLSPPGSVQRPATNRKETSLSTIAIMNSARKMARVMNQHQRSLSRSPARGTKSPAKHMKSPARGTAKDQEDGQTDSRSRRVQIICHPLEEEEDDSPEVPEERNTRLTPRYPPRMNRAISTPSGVLNNITFYNMEQNMTMIPPSPIPTSLPIRVYSDDDTVTPMTPPKGRGKGKVAEDIIFMFSPDKPLPKPRKWNVHSPAPVDSQRSRLSQVEEGSQENAPEDSITTLRKEKTTGKKGPATRKSGRHKKSVAS